ncbi:restriction endonuclease subunit S [Paraprevotella clara]|uniref:restriction endonuclease subunit S n=1 Tax=Paraprevotella clara TaxID=454154 RepID=UPI003AB3983B
MTTNKNHNSPNVPNLRFPEFEGEWKKTKFGDIATGFDYGMNAAAKNYDGVNKYIRITDIDEASSTYTDKDIVSPDGILTDNYLVNNRDILLARTGASTGKSYLYKQSDGKLYYAGFLIRANVTTHDPYFVFSQLHTHRYWRWVSIMSARSGQPGINSQEYSSFPIYTTSIEEESKIAKLLSLLDERIATQNKIIEDLKKLKSAISERLFKSVKGSIVLLSDICDIVKGKQINGENLSERGRYYVMNGGTEPSGYYDDYNVEANTISISEGGNSCGYVQFNTFPFWSGGHCYSIQNVTGNVDNLYLYHYLKSNEDNIMKLRIGSGLPNIQKKDLAMFKIIVPTLEQQMTISTFLSSIERKAEIERRIQNAIQKQKLYLLQQMFI